MLFNNYKFFNNRRYSRQLHIQPDYCEKPIDCIINEKSKSRVGEGRSEFVLIGILIFSNHLLQ